MNRSPPSAACILDISRLLSRAGQPAPTGIDRVELAYADHLLHHHNGLSHFVALSVTGHIRALPPVLVRHFILSLLAGWQQGEKAGARRASWMARLLKLMLMLPGPSPAFGTSPVYLLLSHHHLMQKRTIQAFLTQTRARFVPMVHDLIPIEYPEYARPREPARHRARMHTVALLAEAILVPTNGVGRSFAPLLGKAGRPHVPVWTIPHGVHGSHVVPLANPGADFTGDTPCFVYLGTIEPRKNHLLLLHIWRNMVEQRGKANVPRLVLAGKRGWENENILDMLDRCPALHDVVIERNHLSDEAVSILLHGACGLLFPSFAEGYGLPLIEAMNLSVPSICADIAVLREAGGPVPLYLDPLDGPGWQEAIDDFARHGPLWQAQKTRLTGWSPLSWRDSVSRALSLCTTLGRDD